MKELKQAVINDSKDMNAKILLPMLIAQFLTIPLFGQEAPGAEKPPIPYLGKEKPVYITDTTRILIRKPYALDPRKIKKEKPYVERDHEAREKVPDSILQILKKVEDRKFMLEEQRLKNPDRKVTRENEGEKPQASFDINPDRAGSPPDNTIAVSRQGFVVAADNSQIGFYKTDGTTLDEFSYPDFLNSVMDELGDDTSDPKVIYDWESDQFIFFIQAFSGDANDSECVLAFSNSQDPMEGWNIYVFHDFRRDEDLWFDYPGLASNEEEVFLTGNLFDSGDDFGGNVVFQLDKDDGFAGRDMDALMWRDVTPDWSFNPAGSILPLASRAGFFLTQGIYMVSVNSFGGSEAFVYHIDDDINHSPEMKKFNVDITDYETPTKVSQKDTKEKLDGGDCRVKGGFYMNGRLYFVFARRDADGFNGIACHRIRISNHDVTNKFFHDNQVTEYCYPNIVHRGRSKTDKRTLLVYLRSGPERFPQIRMRKLKSSMSAASASRTIETSDSFRNQANTSTARWGDYIGIQRRSPSSSKFWIAGHTANVNNRWSTQIIEMDMNQ